MKFSACMRGLPVMNKFFQFLWTDYFEWLIRCVEDGMSCDMVSSCTVLDVLSLMLNGEKVSIFHNHSKCPGIWQVVYSCLNWMLDLVSRCQVKVHISKEMVDQCFCPLPQAKTMPSMQQWSHPILFSLVCIEDFCLHVQFGHEEVS